MTSFKLERKSTGRVLTNFKVTDDKGAVYGSINVPNEAVSDLLEHWKETTPAPAAASKQILNHSGQSRWRRSLPIKRPDNPALA